MNRRASSLKASAAGAFAALLALASCGSNTAGNQSSTTAQNAAAIATEAARTAANEMHNQMGNQPRDDAQRRDPGAMGDGTTMNGSHVMGMDNMPARPGMQQDNMPGMGGNSMANQAMPMEREDHM
jgi:hypothetical protein